MESRSAKQANFFLPLSRVELLSGNRSFAFSIGLHLIALVFVTSILMGSPPKRQYKMTAYVHFIDVPPKQEQPEVKSEPKTQTETKQQKLKKIPQPTTVSYELPPDAPRAQSEILPATNDETVSSPPIIMAAIQTSDRLLVEQKETQVEAIPGNYYTTAKFQTGESVKPHVSDEPVEAVQIAYEDLRGIESSFALLIREMIAAAKAYPSPSRKSGHEGKVLVAFALGKDGQILDLTVDQSSGYEKLDQAAMQAVKNASPYPPIPDKLGRETIVFKLPISFNLR